jgi:crotonobetainyl-CoA:carnitine CoA-transferase CaiB-like acyl-CoA transferase
VELSRFVGAAYGAKWLAELGADVVAIEPPGGHPLRARPVHAGSDSDSLFQYLFTNKRLALLDLESAEGLAELRRRAEQADVIVTDYLADELEAAFEPLGGIDALCEERLLLRLKPFIGRDDESGLPSTYFTAYHSGGEGYLMPGGTDYLDRPPVSVAQYAGEYDAGTQGAIAAMAALYARRAGMINGERIEVSVQASVASIARVALGYYANEANDGPMESRATRGRRLGTTLRCADGFVELMAVTPASWAQLVELMGAPEWTARPDVSDPMWRRANIDELNVLLEEWTQHHGKDEIRELCQAAHIPLGSVETLSSVLQSEQARSRGFFEAGESGRFYPRLPFSLADGSLPAVADAVADAGSSPRGGSEAGAPDPAPSAPVAAEAATARPRPLEGLRVVEFTWYWAVPYAGLLLAALGAEVIKVESQSRLDPMRLAFANPAVGPELFHETGVMFHDANLGKRSITLDMGADGAAEVALDLVSRADIVLQNYSVGVLERLGLGYDRLREVNPDVIIVSETSVGEQGPASHYVGFATVFGALSGLADCTGYPDAPPADVRDGADLRIAVTCAATVLALLLRRQAGGGGDLADLSAVEACSRYVGEALVELAGGGEQYRRSANHDPVFVPNNAYRCEGEDRWIAISIRDDADWEALRAISGIAALADSRFATAGGRRAAEDELDGIIGTWTAGHGAAELSARLQRGGVPAAAVTTAEEFWVDPVLEAAGFIPNVEHPVMGQKGVVDTPWEFTRLQASVQQAAPILGEANDYVFRELLAMEPAAIARLESEGAIR